MKCCFCKKEIDQTKGYTIINTSTRQSKDKVKIQEKYAHKECAARRADLM